ncbi:MAG: HEAT repeat domain-containing protein [Myxococcales bacterium]|nr:HEAT repeat domain-containing protein [Myxococcales bacterium]
MATGPIRWLTQSPGRHAIGITGSAALLFLCSYLVSRYIQHSSTSVGVDLILITLAMALLLATSALEALLVANIVLGHSWNESTRLRAPNHHQSLDNIEDLEVAARRSRSSPVRTYALFVLGFVVINGYFVERLTAGFVQYYRDFGYYNTTLRSGDPEKIREALTGMADAQNERLADYALDVIPPLLASETPAIREAALDAYTVIGRRMSLSVDLLNLENARTDRWEYRLNQDLREHIAPVIQAIAKVSTAETQTKAIMALGGFRNTHSIPFLAELVKTKENDHTVALAAVTALAEMRDLSAIPPLLDVLRQSTGESQLTMMAIFGIGEVLGHWRPSLADKEPPAVMNQAVEKLAGMLPEMQGITQCVTVDAFRKIRDARAAPALFRVFESPGSDFLCPDVEIPRKSMPPFALSQRERFRIRVLRAVSLIAVENDEVMTWLSEQAERKSDYSEDIIRELENVFHMAKAATARSGLDELP